MSEVNISIYRSEKMTKQNKVGRKPYPISPALRKAQNRAAQKAFRERKERHLRDLELDYKRLLNEREKYQSKSEQLNKENDILKCENWYLKGIMLSLQLVCFRSKLCIPKHTPHIDDRALRVMAESAPASIAAYIDVNCRRPSPKSNHDSAISYSMQPSIINNDDLSSPPSSSQPDKLQFHHVHQNSTNATDTDEMEKIQPVLLRSDTVTNNLAAIQALRLQLRVQSAISREKSDVHNVAPTALQLSVPHDPRIDLIPTPHMRDRMIIFRDQFDLDDCLRLLANEAYFHGGDITLAGNWELPISFFEKYWFLTIDYTQERISKRWKQLRTKATTTDGLPTNIPSESHNQTPNHSLPLPDGLQRHHQHRSTDSIQYDYSQQPPTFVVEDIRDVSSQIAPSLTGLDDSSDQQSNFPNFDPPPSQLQPSTVEPYEFMKIVEDNFLHQGLNIDDSQQHPQLQPPWTQSFPSTDL
ncbi:hypothetical protein BCR42DRAFT_407924 [Absidia repens]|uniref:BZIP domain-containing protein n=1 Tax=Absidia repens TaxID=90262 RepID=A0A1X2ISW4_9FUNG|nr:hypothetical protein BCR42DRAFT_407924 [Absidia repens]